MIRGLGTPQSSTGAPRTPNRGPGAIQPGVKPRVARPRWMARNGLVTRVLSAYTPRRHLWGGAKMLNRIASCALAIALVIPVCAAAQTSLGRLTGTVRDTQNARLPGATVELRNAATGALQRTTTNEIGVFTFPQVPV